MRTTQTASLEVVLNLTPLDLYVQKAAANSALRLNQCNVCITSQTGHAQILPQYANNNICTNYITPYLDFKKSFSTSFPNRQGWENDTPITNETSISIYTDGDGSKIEVGTGAGFFSERLNIASSFRLPNHSRVFQHEILIVTNAAKQVSMMALSHADITFFIENQAAIKAISATLAK